MGTKNRQGTVESHHKLVRHASMTVLPCRPVVVGSGESAQGARLGGLPPENIVPADKASRYFATVPFALDPPSEVSIYLSFDFDQMASVSRRILSPSDSLLEVVVHDPVQRTDRTNFESELSAHPLVIHAPAPDWFVSSGEKVIESGHKIGGRPYVEQPGTQLLAQLRGVAQEGFRQFVQLGFPSGQEDAVVTGDWPFADGLFHLLSEQSPTAY